MQATGSPEKERADQEIDLASLSDDPAADLVAEEPANA